MAEFCQKCSRELGLYENDEPCYCKNCKKYIESKSLLQQTKKGLAVCKYIFCNVFCKMFG